MFNDTERHADCAQLFANTEFYIAVRSGSDCMKLQLCSCILCDVGCDLLATA